MAIDPQAELALARQQILDLSNALTMTVSQQDIVERQQRMIRDLEGKAAAAQQKLELIQSTIPENVDAPLGAALFTLSSGGIQYMVELTLKE